MQHNPLLKIHDATRTATKADGTKLQVIDSPLSTIIQPTTKDIENGIPGDHSNCMYCVACRRLFDSELVWVTRNVAYVELKNKKGVSELHRFILKDPARDKVKGFDQDKMNVTPEAVIFAAPSGSRRLDAIKANWHKWNERQKKGASQKAHIKGHGIKKASKRHEVNSFHTLRSSGSGMFQFPRK